MDQLGRTLNERDLRQLARDRKKEEDERRKTEENMRREEEQRKQIMEEELRKFQRQRQELLRLVNERKAEKKEERQPRSALYSGEEDSGEDLNDLVTVDMETTRAKTHSLGESYRFEGGVGDISDSELAEYFIPRSRIGTLADKTDVSSKNLRVGNAPPHQSTPKYREEKSIDLEIELLEKRLAMVKKVRDKEKLQKTDKDQQPSFMGERRNTGLLDLPKGRRISDTDVFEMESNPSSFQRKEVGGKDSEEEGSYIDRRGYGAEAQINDGLYRFQTDENEGFGNKSYKERMMTDKEYERGRISDLPKQWKQSKDDFDFYSTDPNLRKETKKQQVSFSDPIKQEIPVSSEMDSLIWGDKYELKKTYESSIHEMEMELKRRERELEKRENWIKLQEKKRKEQESESILERLKKKETEMQQKLALLTQRELEIEKKEASLRQLDYPRDIQDQIVEKENEPSKVSYHRRLEKIDESSSQTEKKETEMQQKLALLTQRELEIEKKAASLRQLDYPRVIQDQIVEKENEPSKGSYHRRFEKIVESSSQTEKKETAASNIVASTSISQSESTQTDMEEHKSDANKEKLGTQYSFPKFTVFSGEEPKPKTEATYEEWLYEVKSVQNDGIFSDQAIGQAIRKSLKGQAKQVLIPLGTSATLEQTLNKLEAMFGNMATGDSVMQEFYTATQNQGETVTAWSLRIEDIVERAIKKRQIRKEEKDKKLRDRFWNYLRNERLKNATRTKYENLVNFEDLRRAVREEENDMKVRSGVQHQVTQQGKQSCQKEISEDKLDQIMEEINNLKQQMAYQRQPWRDRRRFDKKGPQQNQQPQKQSPSAAEPDTNTEKKSEN